MKKRDIAFLTVLALPLAASAQDQIAAVKQAPVEQECYLEEPCFYDYDNRIAFSILHLTYERIKPDALYAGIEAWWVPVISAGSRAKPPGRFLTEAEFRIGYNYLFKGRNHVTPFVGGGIIQDLHMWGHASPPAVAYGAFGLLYMHEFSRFFNLGVNFKGMIGGSVDKRHRMNWGSPVGGIDVSLPFTFRLGSTKRWDIRIEPFDIYLHGRKLSRNYFGGRSTIGYRF